MAKDIDTTNACLVGSQGPFITILNPKTVLNKRQALTFAAWIVVQAEEEEGEFAEYLEAVKSS